MIDWAFERDGEGMWHWTHANTRGVERSRRRFSNLWQCVEDAKRNGLEDRTGGAPGRPPALLH